MFYLLMIMYTDDKPYARTFQAEGDLAAIDRAYELLEESPYIEEEDTFELYAMEGEEVRRTL